MTLGRIQSSRIFSVNMSESNLRVIASARAVKDSAVSTTGHTLPLNNAEVLVYSCSPHVELIEYLDQMKF